MPSKTLAAGGVLLIVNTLGVWPVLLSLDWTGLLLSSRWVHGPFSNRFMFLKPGWKICFKLSAVTIRNCDGYLGNKVATWRRDSLFTITNCFLVRGISGVGYLTLEIIRGSVAVNKMNSTIGAWQGPPCNGKVGLVSETPWVHICWTGCWSKEQPCEEVLSWFGYGLKGRQDLEASYLYVCIYF